MSIFGTIDSIKNRGNIHATINLINKDEPYDKTRNVLSGEEIYKLCYDRYLLLNQILLSLKESLSKYLDIVNISFQNNLNGEISIVITYRKNGRNYVYTVNRVDTTLIDVALEKNSEIIDITMANRQAIINVFNEIIDNYLDVETNLYSTSKFFTIYANSNRFSINDIDQKVISLSGDYSDYSNDGLMYDRKRVLANYKKIKSLLENDENVLNVYRHLKVYEDSIDKVLLKK